MNTYAKQLGLPHVIQFKDDMTCMVSQYGRELDFGNLSAGEKKRVNLAMSLAFRDVLHHLHAKDNLLFVDEIDASLCASGVESVVALLNQKTKEDELSTWVIMHREGVEDKFDRKMLVIKENGFSTVSLQSEECK
jgi:DNA repair exonuclease SbcCD ATPase subunit